MVSAKNKDSMIMSREKPIISIKAGSEKSFAIVFSIVFCVIAFYPLLVGGEPWLWCVLVSIILLVIGFVKPKILRVPNQWWFKLGVGLGTVVNPLVMFLVYAIAIVPTGCLLKIFGRDNLQLKFEKNCKSYWKNRVTPLQSFRKQF